MLRLDNKNFFKFESIGEFVSDKEWIHPNRVIDTYELIMVTRGEVYIREEEKQYVLLANQCIILQPQKRHYGWRISKNPTSFYWFHFKTDIEMPFKLNKNNEYCDVKYLLKKLLHMSNTPGYSSYSTEAAALLLFGELFKMNSCDKENGLINKISEYIRINADRGVTVEETAAHFGYNADYIGKLFKNNFGVGIKKYIMSERIKKAKDLLLNTELSVKEISSQLGFSDSNNFVKYFIYHEEISPGKFRNKYFNVHMNNK